MVEKISGAKCIDPGLSDELTLAPLAASCLREDIAVSVGVVKHRYPINIPFLIDSDLRSFPVNPLSRKVGLHGCW
jgi:hypothetical protein